MLQKFLARFPSWALLAALFGVFVACSIGFISLAEEVLDGETAQTDKAILMAINGASNSSWDAVFPVVTHFGDAIGIVAISACIAAFLFFKKKYKDATVLVTGVGGAALLTVLLKNIFERPRPDLWEQLVVETSFSFPSGHAMVSSALAFSVIAIAWRTKSRWYAVAAGALFILLIGFSRLYLGVHYPTDVLAGWLVSGMWVLLVAAVTYRRFVATGKTSNNTIAG